MGRFFLLYNCPMNPRKWRRIVGMIILLVSLAILIWGIWPYADLTRSTPIQPAQMQLPTPESFLWLAVNVV
jgi:TRAP-type C4-dicarboxylate transport system permease small subunit